MGLGGDLLIAAAANEYRRHTGRRFALVYRPRLTDLLVGRLHDATRRVKRSPVLLGNPDLVAPLALGRPVHVATVVNRIADRAVARLGLRRYLDRLLVRLGERLARRRGVRLFYVDSDEFNYAEEVLPDRIRWKPAPNAVAAILSGLRGAERPPQRHPQPRPRLHRLDPERRRMRELLAAHDLSPGAFVVMEPGTNPDWFGSLRAWPLPRWQALVAALSRDRPDRPVVQIGVAEETLVGVVDLRGHTTFREAAAIIELSALFVGTEGGLMHAAATTNTPAVIIWGGVTRADFAGYEDRHMILYNERSCSHCGRRHGCPFDAACIKSVDIQPVVNAVNEALSNFKPGIRPTVVGATKV